MANTPVEVKKTAPVPAGAPESWRSFRTEMDRLFDRFAGGWGMPSLRRMFDMEPMARYESSFTMPTPAVDITEDEAGYKVTAELPGMSEKEIEVVVSDGTLTLKGEKRAEKEQKEKNFYLSERSYGSFQHRYTKGGSHVGWNCRADHSAGCRRCGRQYCRLATEAV
jgi:HSP20 family protein